MRRGLERYAPPEGYDAGPHAREKIAALVVRKAGLFPGDRVLDVQTGTGILGVNIARAFTRSRVVLADANPDNLAHTRQNAREEKCESRCDFVLCLPDELPFKDETFYFSTFGFRLCAEEDPLPALEEIHRVSAFYAKVYLPALDFRKSRKKPEHVHDWVFDDATLAAMREMGYGKIQPQQVALLPDGARVMLVTTKRFDPEGGEEGEEEGEE